MTKKNGTDAPDPKEGEFSPITSQDQLNQVIADRIARERAKFSDYDQLKAEAEELARIRNENQSAEDRFNERISKLEGDLAESRIEKHRLAAVGEHKLDPADIEFLTGSTPEAINEQAKRLADRVADRKRDGNTAANEGKNPDQPSGDPMRDFVRGAFGKD